MHTRASGFVSNEPVPVDHDMNGLLTKIADIDHKIATGKLSHSLVSAMFDDILNTKDFPVWKTLVMREGLRSTKARGVNNYQLGEYYNRLFRGRGYNLRGDYLVFYEDSLERATFEQAFLIGRREVDLVRVTPKSLGFRSPDGVRRGAFYQRALHFGLNKCWYEVAYALRHVYIEQPPGEWLAIATDTNSVAMPDRLLMVGRGRQEDPLCVDAVVSNYKSLVGLDDEYVFIKPRPTS